MLLYHGSDTVISSPRILKPNRALDFWRGFYTTLNEEQAQNFALKVKDRTHSDKAVVNVYEADVEAMRNALSHRWFEGASEDWLDFVSLNRNNLGRETYDFVYGPVANDDIFRTFIAYTSGILTKEETLTRLKVKKLYNQLTFASDEALKYLYFLTSYNL